MKTTMMIRNLGCLFLLILGCNAEQDASRQLFWCGHDDGSSSPTETDTGVNCTVAQEMVQDLVEAWKSGNSGRYLEAFHDDAKVYMLAGHLEDGHQIRGREHLGRCLASMAPREVDEEDERDLIVDATWNFSFFEDTQYTSVESTNSTCEVYISLAMNFSTGGREVSSVGLVRYTVDNETIVAKLSVNDDCAPDRNVDANPDPENRRRLTSLGTEISSCSEAPAAVESYVQSSGDIEESAAFASLEDEGECYVYYSGMNSTKEFLVRYMVDVGNNMLVDKLAIDDTMIECYVDRDASVVP